MTAEQRITEQVEQLKRITESLLRACKQRKLKVIEFDGGWVGVSDETETYEDERIFGTKLQAAVNVLDRNGFIDKEGYLIS